MIVCDRIEEVRRWREEVACGETVGFVPTMGAFHEGHLSLMRRARGDCDRLAVSVFVNPTQFGPEEDFDSYPRRREIDTELAGSVGADLVWFGDREEIYPAGFATRVELPELARSLCGRSRPHHFGGVAVVVLKLLQLFRPHRAYFGRKDYQQSVIVEQLVEDLNLPTRIVTCATVRERSGLAVSSRNEALSAAGRKSAEILQQGLLASRELYRSGERAASAIVLAATRKIRTEPAVVIEYVELVQPRTLVPEETASGSSVVAVAARVEGVRLIDNITLDDSGE